jgi:hypothetical protein
MVIRSATRRSLARTVAVMVVTPLEWGAAVRTMTVNTTITVRRAYDHGRLAHP